METGIPDEQAYEITEQVEGDTRGHTHELLIDATPEQVWKAITEARELENWFPLGAEVELGLGGSITYAWGEAFKGMSVIEAWSPPHHLRTTWMEPAGEGDEQPRALRVDWHLEAQGGKTVLRLVHSGFGSNASFDTEYDGTRSGWSFELRSLRHYLEHHAGKQRRAFWIQRPVTGEGLAVWERFISPNGLIADGWRDSPGAGDAYRYVLNTGDVLEGTVLVHQPPRALAATVTNADLGLMRFGHEDCGRGPVAHLWLSTWGLDAGEFEVFERRWDEAMRKTFG
jgi:uncharacterized protein YndB with AHSA1/START domain